MKPFMVVADTREKPEYRWHWPESDSCQGTVVEKLDTGDYSIKGLEHIISIDRKASTGEFAGNMVESRFPYVLTRLGELPFGFIVCEFGYDDVLSFPHGSGIPKHRFKYLKTSSRWMMRYISEVQIHYGVHIILAGNTENAKYVTYNLLRRVWELQ